jgi:hypothetical protein
MRMRSTWLSGLPSPAVAASEVSSAKLRPLAKIRNAMGQGLSDFGQWQAVLGNQRPTSDNALFPSVLSQVLDPSNNVAGRKISGVIDNYRIHFAKPVLALLAAHAEQIEWVTLPTYSPQRESC